MSCDYHVLLNEIDLSLSDSRVTVLSDKESLIRCLQKIINRLHLFKYLFLPSFAFSNKSYFIFVSNINLLDPSVAFILFDNDQPASFHLRTQTNFKL